MQEEESCNLLNDEASGVNTDQQVALSGSQ